MPCPPFISYAQNREDVVLWRALHTVQSGHYVEVGANHPVIDSVSKAFYDRGWSGWTVEPVAEYVELHREQRPRDHQVEAAVTSKDVTELTLHVIPHTGLSTTVDVVSDKAQFDGFQHEDIRVPTRRLDAILESTGWGHDDIHFLMIDVEGSEGDVLDSVDLTVWRPWILVIESTEPRSSIPTHESWEPKVLAAGYDFCLFDGISRFYVAAERSELKASLSYPACALDDYRLAATDGSAVTDTREKDEEIASLTRQLVHWRSTALRGWADAMASPAVAPTSNAHAEAELAAIRQTLSWRITAPLRGVRRLGRLVSRG